LHRTENPDARRNKITKRIEFCDYFDWFCVIEKRVEEREFFVGMVIINQARRSEGKAMQLGKYELGKTLGEGNFGKVKLARDTDCGQFFAVKILEKNKIVDLHNTDQVCVSFFNFMFFF